MYDSATTSAARRVSVEYRVGRFKAAASSDAAFDEFRDLIRQRAHESLSDPVRILIMPHVCNAIALKIPQITSATRALIEGFVCELVSEGRLCRIGTISKEFKPYHVVYTARSSDLISKSLEQLRSKLRTTGRISFREAKRIVDRTVAQRAQNITILLGHFAYAGEANMTIEEQTNSPLIFLPNA